MCGPSAKACGVGLIMKLPLVLVCRRVSRAGIVASVEIIQNHME